MPGDRIGYLDVRAAVVERNGQIELKREVEHLIEPVPLQSVVGTTDMFEVEADLSDGHHHLVRGELPERVDIGRGLLERVVSDPGPYLLESVGQRNGAAAALHIRAHGDHSSHAGGNRCFHHRVRLAKLFEVQMRVYKDGVGSSSTTSSSRLKRASGCGSVRPGASSDTRQRLSLG